MSTTKDAPVVGPTVAGTQPYSIVPALAPASDVQRPEPTAAPADLTLPPQPVRRFWRQQAIPGGILARGRSGRIAPQRWEAFTDDQGHAYLTLHSQKPSQTPPVIITGPSGELLGLLEAMYWGVRDAVEGGGEETAIGAAAGDWPPAVENAVSGS